MAAAPQAPPAAGRSAEPGLAVGITEPNPNLVSAGTVAPAFAPWRDALGRMRPAYYRLLLDWASLQPDPERPLQLANPDAGCLRAVPCAGWGGLRDQLRALATRQRSGRGRGSRSSAARRAGRRARRAAASAPAPRRGRDRPRRPASPATGGWSTPCWRLPSARGRACATGARGTSRTTRTACRRSGPAGTPSAPSQAAAVYAELTEALQAALDAAPGEQEQVLGELAALDERKPQTTPVGEFLGRLPRATVCRARVFTQHGDVDGFDPTGQVAGGVRRFRCGRPFEIWMTETGVGAPGSGRTRSLAPAVQRRECRAAPPPAPLVGRRSRHRRLPVHPARGPDLPDRARRHLAAGGLSDAGRVAGLGRRPAPGARPIRRPRAPVDD